MNPTLPENSNSSPINPEIIAIIQEVFWDSLVSIWYFGSRTRGEENKYSDIDFVIILDGTEGVDWRESNSPKIKRIMTERWIPELWAFNIYNKANIRQIPGWFKSIIGHNLKPISDVENTLWWLRSSQNASYREIDGMRRAWIVSPLWEEENALLSRIWFLVSVLRKRIDNLSTYSGVVRFYELEILRLEETKRLLESGIFVSSFPSFSDALRLRWIHDISVEVQKRDFEYKMLSERLFHAYENVDLHIQASAKLVSTDTIWALQHLLSACHIEMRKYLHEKWVYIVDGEVTQSYLQNTRAIHISKQIEEFYSVLFKAEQICGRSDLVTFDFDNNGPVYAEKTDWGTLCSVLDRLGESLKSIRKAHTENPNLGNAGVPEISILTPSYNRHSVIKKTVARICELVIPFGKVEFILVDDGSTPSYAENGTLPDNLPLSSRLETKEHSGITDTRNKAIEVARGKYVLFLDDDVEMSPLTLLRLLWRMKNDSVGIVGVTTHWIPTDKFVPNYAHHRWLLSGPYRNKKNEILSVPTCCALINTKAMKIVGGFSTEQWKAGIPFWGEDADLSYRISQAGYTLEHEPRAVVFHGHRETFGQLIRQHIWYGEWCAFHCIERERDFSELAIPEPTYWSVFLDVARYIKNEVPKRCINGVKDGLGIGKTLAYVFLDITRKISYNFGVLKTRHLIK